MNYFLQTKRKKKSSYSIFKIYICIPLVKEKCSVLRVFQFLLIFKLNKLFKVNAIFSSFKKKTKNRSTKFCDNIYNLVEQTTKSHYSLDQASD